MDPGIVTAAGTAARPRRLARLLGIGLILAALVLPPGAAGAAGGRHALVIGNGAYANLEALENPGPDAVLIATALEKRGFSVQQVLDADYETMRAAIGAFREAARDAEVALVYFAGHGVQADGVNYLFPVDAEVAERDDLRRETLLLPYLLHELEAAGPEFGILVLDACRDNPVPALAAPRGEAAGRSLAPRHGLAVADTPTGLLVAYATAPGQIALDGPLGGNSPFAAALAHYLEEPGLEIGLLFRKVSARVREVTAGAQIPWVEASLTGEVLVLNDGPATPDDPIAALNQALEIPESLERQLALTRLVEAHPDSPAAAVAVAYLDELEAAGTRGGSPGDDEATGFEARLADWQRLELLAGGRAQAFAGELFADLYGVAPTDAVGRAGGATAPALAEAEAASLLWPMVRASNRDDAYARYLELFPQAETAAAAAAGIELAALDPPQLPALTATSAHAGAVPATLRVPVIVGTGPVVLPLPAEGAPIIVTDRPRHGRLRAFDAAGVELPLDAEPMAPALLRYEPPPLMRRGLDRLTLAAVAPAGAGRSLGGSADATAPAGAESAPVLVQGPRVAVQLEIGVDACDREAGIRFDQHGVVLGLFPEEVRSERAVAACRAAVERFPEVARFHFQLGIAIDLSGDPEAAVPHYQTAALMGHWLAVNRLGFLHLTGRGLPVDLEKARALIEIAAEQGESHALNNLGRAYLVGEIVPADREKAVDLLLEAAAKGNTFAYNALGRLLLDEGDAERAVPLFRQAAEAGDIYGYNNLGWVYQNGMGVPQDLDQAINWYELAARSGQLNAPINLGFLYKDGAPGLDPDPKRAAFWFAEAARGGNLWGSVHLAQLYADGAIGDAADPVLAAKLYARVAWRDAETGRFAAQQSHGGAGVAARERFAALSSRAVVAAVQSELARLGFDPGPVDGLPGQRTEAAIEAFARSRAVSLPPDLPPIDLLGELVRVSTG